MTYTMLLFNYQNQCKIQKQQTKWKTKYNHIGPIGIKRVISSNWWFWPFRCVLTQYQGGICREISTINIINSTVTMLKFMSKIGKRLKKYGLLGSVAMRKTWQHCSALCCIWTNHTTSGTEVSNSNPREILPCSF